MKVLRQQVLSLSIKVILALFVFSITFSSQLPIAEANVNSPSNSSLINVSSNSEDYANLGIENEKTTLSENTTYETTNSLLKSIEVVVKAPLISIDSDGNLVLAKSTKYETTAYLIDSGKPGPVVMVVGGIHGHGVAGYKAAAQFKNFNISKGSLIVLPEANIPAIAINSRLAPGDPDLNRIFPKEHNQKAENILAEAIFNLVKTYNVDWLIDMHEGPDFYIASNKKSFGQTIIYQPNAITQTFVENLANEFNSSISSSNEHFSVLRFPARGSLTRSSAELLGVNSFLLETSMKKDLSTRINYHILATTSLLEELDMLVKTPLVSIDSDGNAILAKGSKYETKAYINDSGKPGPVVMVVGGIHGHGVAGYKAATEFKDFNLDKGSLIVLPEANVPAIAVNSRLAPNEPDLNRAFPKDHNQEAEHILAEAIFDLVKTYNVDWLIDMHEGPDFYIASNKKSFGQTMIYQPNNTTQIFLDNLATEFNSSIPGSNEHFSVLRFPAQGSLARSSAELLGVNSFLLETCMKQDLSTRVNYHLSATNNLLANLGMIEAPPSAIKESRSIVPIAKGTIYETELHVINSGKPGPVVMIVGGIHGSETAGYRAANLAKDYSPKSGTLLVLPEANKLAIVANRRSAPGEGDLNRAFPTSASGNPSHILSRAIYDVVKEYKVEWLMDMHEGFDYYKNSSTSSVGQTLIHYPSAEMTPVAENILNELNKSISRSSQQFSLLSFPAQGSLARGSGQYLGVNSFIFESCMKETLSSRINRQITAMDSMLKQLNMI